MRLRRAGGPGQVRRPICGVDRGRCAGPRLDRRGQRPGALRHGLSRLGAGATILAPIRQQAISRETETAWLADRGIVVPPKTSKYSVNRGLWGATIGGLETHRSDGVLPEEAVPADGAAFAAANRAAGSADRLPARRAGAAGRLAAGSGRARSSASAKLAGRHGVGRGMHVGDTILGIKGRVAFEAPAAVTLIAAHRELEKLVLSRQQLFWKSTLGDLYGAMLHEARFFDPLMRDLEAFLASTQQRVKRQRRGPPVSGSGDRRGRHEPLFADGPRHGRSTAREARCGRARKPRPSAKSMVWPMPC